MTLRMIGRQFISLAMMGGVALFAFAPEPAMATAMRSGPPKKAEAAPPASNPGAPSPGAANPSPVTPPETKPDTPSANAKALPGEANEPLTGEADNAEGSGLPIPRFVSLRTDPVNMRSGPGLRYPVEWVYRRRHLPVEVIAEFDTWRQIRDPDGTTGWVHQSMITGRRTGMVHGTAQALRRSDGDEGNAVATLEAGVIVNIQRCPAGSSSCRVEVNGLQGWLKRDQMWGVYPTEAVE